MKRIKLSERVLPTYTKGEEIFNMVSHIIGGVIGIVAIVLCSVIGAKHNNPYGIISGIIFGITLLVLYTMSSIYHGLSPNLKAKKVFQIIDHCSIFLLIAGSYTPFCLCTLRKESVATAWTVFGIIWAIAIVGIVLNSIDLKKFRKFSMFCYLLMGWLIIFKINVLIEYLGIAGFTLLLAGGLVYTLGAILYAVGKKHKWMHSVFHVLCIISSILHLLCVLLYVI